MVKIFSLLLVAAVLLIVSPVVSAEVMSSIAALVNDEPITTYDVDKEREAMEKGLEDKAPRDAAGKAQLREVALNSLINKKLIEQKIKELDVKITDEEVRQTIEDVKKSNNITQDNLVDALTARGISFDEYKAQIREQLERLRLISLEVRSKIQISETEVRAFYDANPKMFQVDEAFRVRQIFFKVSPQASEQDRKRITAVAEKVLQEAKSGADFAALAKKYSEDSSAREGGDLGSLKKGDILPEFEETLVKMKPGDISGLIRTQAGVHILKLEEFRQGKQRGFDASKLEIEDILYKKKSEERFNQWIEDLRKNASIEIKAAK